MGQVWQATDIQLNRQVALKILPDAFADDPDRLARFQREAQVLASLNHPNIAAIHGIEQSDDTQALVLELVEGPTLADRIARGPIPVDEALPIAKQIAEALEAAHEAGVIHRDLKPANIKVRDDGTVKVLDFGLAKALDPSTEGDPSQSPTLTAAATQMGVIMGTAAYMSPEQARGKSMGTGSDIWAFGAVLYEMLTGRRAFEGATVSDTLAAVLKSEPDWRRVPASSPLALRRLLKRMLTKERKRRLQHIGDARVEVEDAASDGDTAAEDNRVPPERRGLVLAVVAVVAAGVGVTASLGVVALVTPQEVEPAAVIRTSIALPAEQHQPRRMKAPLAISPDGALVAYVARDESGAHLYLRRLDSFESTKVPGAENPFAPFFSADGQWVGFFAAGWLKKVSISLGSPQNVTPASHGFGGSWGADDTIVFAPNIGGGLWRVSASGGEPTRLTTPDPDTGVYAHVWPQLLPGDRGVLFTMWGDEAGAYLLDLATGGISRARDGSAGADVYVSSGHLVFADEATGDVLAVPFDLERLAVTGVATPVLDDVRYLDSQSARPFLAVSDSGTAVYVSAGPDEAQVVWVTREGDVTPITSEEGGVAGIRLSPDGRTVAFHDEQGNLWRLDTERQSVDILVPGEAFYSHSPVWSPDGQRVTFSSNEAGSWDVYEIDVATRGEPRPLVVREFDQRPESWSGDGRLLAFIEAHPVTGYDIWVVAAGEDPLPVLQSESNEFSPMLSPDGRLLAYVSDESGRYEVYVRTHPGGEVRAVSTNGGEEPAWSRSGEELFFRSGDQFMSVVVTSAQELDVSAPVALGLPSLARAGEDAAWGSTYYDVAPGANRILGVSDRSTTQFLVIQNWFTELERLVPVN